MEAERDAVGILFGLVTIPVTYCDMCVPLKHLLLGTEVCV